MDAREQYAHNAYAAGYFARINEDVYGSATPELAADYWVFHRTNSAAVRAAWLAGYYEAENEFAEVWLQRLVQLAEESKYGHTTLELRFGYVDIIGRGCLLQIYGGGCHTFASLKPLAHYISRMYILANG